MEKRWRKRRRWRTGGGRGEGGEEVEEEEEEGGRGGGGKNRGGGRGETPTHIGLCHSFWPFFISFLSVPEIRHFLPPCRLNHLPACSVSLRETPLVFCCHKVPLRIFWRRRPQKKRLSSCFHVRFSERKKQLKYKRSSHFPIIIYIFLHNFS